VKVFRFRDRIIGGDIEFGVDIEQECLFQVICLHQEIELVDIVYAAQRKD
jgi:hypothetical protein